MAFTSMFDPATMEGRIGRQMMQAMQKEIDAIAEPIMQKALAEIHEQMKRRMGSIAIGLLESSYSVERFGPELRILVHVKEPKA